MKRIISKPLAALLALILLLSACMPALNVLAAETVRPVLKFRADGTFRILQISDTQDTDQLHIGTAKLIEAALDKVKPDLVVYTGDNVAGYWLTMNKTKMKAAIDAIVGPVSKRGIPFAVVPGNHDGESIKGLVTLKDQLNMYMAYPTCLAVDDGKLTGCSTYNLLVKNNAGTKDLLNIYMVDSGGYKLIGNNQDLIAQDQIDWYKAKSDELKILNGGTPMPSILFQHIPVPEFYTELMTEVPEGTEGAVSGKGAEAGKYFLPDESRHLAGSLGESPCVSDKNMGFYDAWVQKGDVFAAFFGHDHKNDYVGKTDDGITLGYCRGTGFHVYGDGTKRGVRSFTFHDNDIKNFETESIYYSDIVSTEMPVMPVYNHIPWHENYNFWPDIEKAVAFLFNCTRTVIGIIGGIL